MLNVQPTGAHVFGARGRGRGREGTLPRNHSMEGEKAVLRAAFRGIRDSQNYLLQGDALWLGVEIRNCDSEDDGTVVRTKMPFVAWLRGR